MAASISYQAAATQAGGASSRTLSFTVASAAGQDRLLALCSITSDFANTTYINVEIDSQHATQVGSYARVSDGGVNGPILSFWRAAGTSNTSINVTCTIGAGAVFDLRGAIWTLSNAGTALATTTGTLTFPVNPTATLSLALNTVTNGATAGAVLFYNTTTQAVSWTGLTERFQGHNLYGSDQGSFADLTVSSGSTPLTVSTDFAAGDFNGPTRAVAAVAVSFNPSATGTTLTAAAGSYALTGTTARENIVMPLGAAGA